MTRRTRHRSTITVAPIMPAHQHQWLSLVTLVSASIKIWHLFLISVSSPSTLYPLQTEVSASIWFHHFYSQPFNEMFLYELRKKEMGSFDFQTLCISAGWTRNFIHNGICHCSRSAAMNITVITMYYAIILQSHKTLTIKPIFKSTLLILLKNHQHTC